MSDDGLIQTLLGLGWLFAKQHPLVLLGSVMALVGSAGMWLLAFRRIKDEGPSSEDQAD